MRIAILLLLPILALLPIAAEPASSADVDRLTTYSTILGRAAACGADTSSAMGRVGRWMDRRFPPGSSDQKKYLPVFMEGVRYAAKQQRAGRTPDSCSQALKTYRRFNWP